MSFETELKKLIKKHLPSQVTICTGKVTYKQTLETPEEYEEVEVYLDAEVIKSAEKLGLESGSKFKFVDMPHIQFRHGLTIQEAKKRLLSGNLENGFIKVR